jgi:AraC-like DNA-binding protein
VNHRIAEFVRECQIFAGTVPQTSVTRHQPTVEAFVSRLPTPERPIERIVFRTLLCDVARHWGVFVHAQYHRSDRACAFDPSLEILRYGQRADSESPQGFAEWATGLLHALDRSHEATVPLRIKAHIDQACHEPLDLASLARSFGCQPARLRTLFKSELRMSIREYQTRRRVCRAATMLAGADVKVEAVALMVGFRRRKNFYQAFRRLVESQPSAVRRWGTVELSKLEERLGLLDRGQKH